VSDNVKHPNPLDPELVRLLDQITPEMVGDAGAVIQVVRRYDDLTGRVIHEIEIVPNAPSVEQEERQ